MQAGQQLHSKPKTLSKALLMAMAEYDWPGNVRELENTCWRMASSTSHEQLDVQDWKTDESASTLVNSSWQEQLTHIAFSQLQQGQQLIHAPLKVLFEQCLLDAAMQYTGGHKQQAAKLLGLGRNTLSRKLAEAPNKSEGKS